MCRSYENLVLSHEYVLMPGYLTVAMLDSMRCIYCSKPWKCGRLHIVVGIWLDMPADMQQWVPCVGGIGVQCGDIECGKLCWGW